MNKFQLLKFTSMIMSSTVALTTLLVGCGSEDGLESDRLGVASECSEKLDCPEVVIDEEDVQLQCLTQFDGGYCAIEGCDSALDCPGGSTCVAHDDGKNYCFRECVDKSECNANRSPENEANCSSNFEYADSADEKNGVKACVPPSSGS